MPKALSKTVWPSSGRRGRCGVLASTYRTPLTLSRSAPLAPTVGVSYGHNPADQPELHDPAFCHTYCGFRLTTSLPDLGFLSQGCESSLPALNTACYRISYGQVCRASQGCLVARWSGRRPRPRCYWPTKCCNPPRSLAKQNSVALPRQIFDLMDFLKLFCTHNNFRP